MEKSQSICIASSVTSDHLLISGKEVFELGIFEEAELKFADKYCIQKYFTELARLENKVNSFIESSLSNRNESVEDGFTPIVQLDFKKQVIKVNYQEKTDFVIGVLFTLHQIIKKTIKNTGTLYIFNRSELSQDGYEQILSFLAVNNKLSFENLLGKANELFTNENIALFNEKELRVKLASLLDIGYVDYDSQRRLMLTGKGHILSNGLR
jgi:hypothetical protein